MSTCTIVGTIKDSGNLPLSGQLWVQLDGAIVDTDTTPDSSLLTKFKVFTIAAGVVSIGLAQSETSQTTYWFRFFATNVANLSGVDDTASLDFHAFVPNLATVELANLIPTGITKDTLDTAIARLARILTLNQDYVEALRGGPRWKTAYDPAIYYQRDDAVSYAGGVWIYINANPAAGQTPSLANPTYWLPGLIPPVANNAIGQDTVYDATGWDAATWAPSANAVRDIVEQLARANNAALAGNPTAPTQAVGNNSTRLATTAFAIAEIIARFTSPNFLGTPTAPTPLLADNSGTVANTNFVKSTANRYSRIIDQKTAGTPGGAAVAGNNTRALNTIAVNSGDVVTLASNTITLRPGTYRVRASAPAWGVGTHRLILLNTAGSTVYLLGSNARSDSAAATLTRAFLTGVFTIAANTDLVILHSCASAQASTNALGYACADGNADIFTEIEIWRTD